MSAAELPQSRPVVCSSAAQQRREAREQRKRRRELERLITRFSRGE